jgi:hypothetical protein
MRKQELPWRWETMEPVYVYRMDCRTKAEIPLGTLFERRKEERGDNTAGMLRLARKEFARTPTDGRNIFVSHFRYD